MTTPTLLETPISSENHKIIFPHIAMPNNKEKCLVEPTLVTPEMAAKWILAYGYPKQRKLRVMQVNRLVSEIRRNAFLGFTDITFTQVAGAGDWQQTDGQHRLHAIANSGIAQWLVVKWRDAIDENERANIYGRTDRGLPRSTRDNLIAHELYNELGFTKTQVSSLQAAVRVLAGGFTRNLSLYTIADDLLMDGMRDLKQEAAMFFSAIAGGDSALTSRLSSSPPMAVALMTFRYQPVLAANYWKRIAANSGLNLGEPEHSTVRLLTKYTVQKLGVPKYGRSIASAWNALIDGRRIVLLPANASKPIRLLGTPYTGQEDRFYLPPTSKEG